MADPYLDLAALKSTFRPASDWARICGERVTAARKALGFDLNAFAALVGVPMPTIYRIERGTLIPKDYLRHAIAYATCKNVADLWPPMTRPEMHKVAA